MGRGEEEGEEWGGVGSGEEEGGGGRGEREGKGEGGGSLERYCAYK